MFNELSVNPLSKDKYEAITKVTEFVNTISAARRSGFDKIRSEFSPFEIKLSPNYSLRDWLNDNSVSRDLKNFLFGTIVTPFINEDDESIGDNYVEANYYFENNDKTEVECLGLAAAFLYETLSISFNSDPIWRNNQLPIIIRQDETITHEQVYNVFSKDCFEEEIISKFVEGLGEIELLETELKPEDKKIHLADHHGKDDLRNLCNRIKDSVYVIEMRSTNWGGKKFIRKIHKDGVIEIVLVNSDREYALWVQTTGKNYRETKNISEYLEERYS